MDLDAVESGFDRGPRGLAVILDDAGDLRRFERPRLGGFGKAARPIGIDEVGLRFGADSRRGDRFAALRLERVVGYPPDMPHLHDDLATGFVDRIRDLAPAGEGLRFVKPGHVGIALALVAYCRPFGDQQAGGCALLVIGDVKIIGHCLG